MLLSQAQNFENYIKETSAVKNGGLFLSAVLETEPTMRKTGNPYFGHVIKIQKIRASAGFDYETLVNNRLRREGKESEFEAEKPKGRHHLSNSVLITESDKVPGQYHMNIFLLNTDCEIYETYIDKRNGQVIEKKELLPYLPKDYHKAPLQGGLENPIHIIAPKLHNIRELTCGDFKYNGK